MDDEVRLTAWDRFWFWRTYQLPRVWRERIPMAVVRLLPRRVMYWALVIGIGKAWVAAGDKHPDELTYQEIVSQYE
jgi:hypothetical protein